jgi:hypothetical protein
MKVKIIGLLAAVILVAALVAVASGATGAYFSDKQPGTITGDIGTIKITAGANADFGGGLGFHWANMLPGTPYSATVYFQNSSNNTEDVWLTFPNLTALSTLNTLGHYGAVHIVVNGTEIYANTNLNDIPNNGTEGLPAQKLLQAGLAPGQSGWMTFTFEYASIMSTQEPGGVFNKYPIPQATNHDARYPAGGEQMVVRSQDGSGNGLPFAIVATQIGITPDNPGVKFP